MAIDARGNGAPESLLDGEGARLPQRAPRDAHGLQAMPMNDDVDYSN